MPATPDMRFVYVTHISTSVWFTAAAPGPRCSMGQRLKVCIKQSDQASALR